MTEEINQEIQQAEAPQEQVQQEQTQDLSAEDRARAYGWKPQDEYKGDPDKWRDAGAFLGEVEQKAYANRILEKEISKLRQGQEALLNHMTLKEREAEKRGYELALKEVAKRQEQAVESADLEAFRQLEADRQKLQSDYQEKFSKVEEKKPAVPDIEPEVAQELEQWAARNRWLENDRVAQAAVSAFVQEQVDRNPYLTPKQRIESAQRFLEAKFPERMGKQSPRIGSEGGFAGKPANKNWAISNLPKELQQDYERVSKFTRGKVTAESYMQTLKSEYGTVENLYKQLKG